jgi:hypothetical protein
LYLEEKCCALILENDGWFCLEFTFYARNSSDYENYSDWTDYKIINFSKINRKNKLNKLNILD